MDLITETSLEALILKATDGRNKGIDHAAVDAFCGILLKSPEYAYTATKLVAQRIQAPDEWEAVQALSVLDTCMKRCGPSFHVEIGKFRFLNEMIKLVSPKYLGPRTSPKVRDIAIKLLHSWTILHSKEAKIKEAYDMLKKQGVVIEEQANVPDTRLVKNYNNPVDNEFENKLKKLLASKNPLDLEAANRMIKSKVMETEKRSTELERVRTNVRLLSDMVNNCHPEALSSEDLQLMQEIHAECERLRPVVFRLAGETQESDTLSDILNLSEELTQVFERYNLVMRRTVPTAASASALLDFSSPISEFRQIVPVQSVNQPVVDLLGAATHPIDFRTVPVPDLNTMQAVNFSAKHVLNEIDQLGAIFESLGTSAVVQKVEKPVEKTNKQKAMDELDMLGEILLQQCKNDIKSDGNKGIDDELMDLAGPKSIDEAMLGASDKMEEPVTENGPTEEEIAENGKMEPSSVLVKPLTDVSVSIEKITPSDVAPLRILESTNGTSIIIHLAKDCPREDVSVFVITTTSLSNLPLSDYLFQVVVPKGCKFKLQPPSTSSLPAHNPFLPPSAITQILLIANPLGLKLRLTFMLSFTMEGETVTEVGEIQQLPISK